MLLGALIVVLLYTALGGRAFCGWVCPVGLVSDAAHWWKRRFKVRGQIHVARSGRFWIMALALPVSALTGVAAFEWLSPVGIVQRELIYGPTVGAAVTIAAIALMDVFVLRDGWCGSLCPLGAFFSLLGRFSLVRIRFAAERCDRCGDCAVICPEPHVIDFHAMEEKSFIDSGDCLNCARCLEVCTRDAYHFGLRPIPIRTHELNELNEGDRHATKCTE